MLNEGNQIHNFISGSGSGTVINYGSGSDFLTSYGSGSDFLTSYGSGSGSTRQKVTVPRVPVPLPQRCKYLCYWSPQRRYECVLMVIFILRRIPTPT